MTAALWWTLTLVLMFAGLAGTVVPVLPGTTVILAAAIMHHLALGEAHSIGWWSIAGLTVLAVLSYVLAACVIDRYPGTPLATEANVWAAGLVERGNLPAQAYPELAGLARTSPVPGVSRDGIAMRLQSCVDFVNQRDFSSRLRQVLRSVK